MFEQAHKWVDSAFVVTCTEAPQIHPMGDGGGRSFSPEAAWPKELCINE